jgi:hypothetical protein
VARWFDQEAPVLQGEIEVAGLVRVRTLQYGALKHLWRLILVRDHVVANQSGRLERAIG